MKRHGFTLLRMMEFATHAEKISIKTTDHERVITEPIISLAVLIVMNPIANRYMLINFYCQIKCGHEDFSIEEWNKADKEIEAMPISEYEKQKLRWPDPCKEQCFDCIAIVGATRLKNKPPTPLSPLMKNY